MALFAMLFALTPALEAVACVAKGCDVSCSEQVDRIQVSQDGQSSSGACSEGHCICAASHCSHVAIPAPEAIASTILVEHSRAAPIVAQTIVSSTSQTPERPPRA